MKGILRSRHASITDVGALTSSPLRLSNARCCLANSRCSRRMGSDLLTRYVRTSNILDLLSVRATGIARGSRPRPVTALRHETSQHAAEADHADGQPHEARQNDDA